MRTFSQATKGIRRRGMQFPPPLVLISIYAALVLIGTVLLKLPIAANVPITWSESLFSATSAVTVTGLSVVDVGSDLTFFGQIVMMVLIQLGGLGLMTFAVLVLQVIGLPVGFAQRAYLREDLNQTSAANLSHLVKDIVRIVLVFEGLGALCLMVVFVPEFGLIKGIWHSVFHSVSAFNNAGFALFPDSLSHWVGNPIINTVIPALFIIGGLGFTVVADLRNRWKWRFWSLHTKLMLVGTGTLLAWSTAWFLVLEWSNPGTLGGLDSYSTRLWAAWFQAAATRTAGFNTLDIGALEDSTTLMFLVLMIIGAGSTSTGGGIKVTTFIVLLLATFAFFKRRTNIDVFGRSIPPEQILKVLALSMVSVLVIFMSTFTLSLFHEGEFLDVVFESVSAFGTVGLSRGITGDFDTTGRVVIMLIMFIGRVGPLSLGFLLATRKKREITYPSATVYLG